MRDVFVIGITLLLFHYKKDAAPKNKASTTAAIQSQKLASSCSENFTPSRYSKECALNQRTPKNTAAAKLSKKKTIVYNSLLFAYYMRFYHKVNRKAVI